jgi:hypothetical protein
VEGYRTLAVWARGSWLRLVTGACTVHLDPPTRQQCVFGAATLRSARVQLLYAVSGACVCAAPLRLRDSLNLVLL